MPACSSSRYDSSMRAAPEQGERATVWQHAQRALALIGKRVIAGTALAAYGHGDWNDSLQPADPAHARSHVQRLDRHAAFPDADDAGARAARDRARCGRGRPRAAGGRRCSGIFSGCCWWMACSPATRVFEHDGGVRYLLHPSDNTTGVRYSALAMIHAILEDMLTPAQAREHLRLIDAHLSAPDGVRLFDRPMPYHGGPQRIFQRAETRDILRPRDRADVHARPSALRAGAGARGRGTSVSSMRCARPIRSASASIVPSATLATGQLLLLQLRCGLRGSLPGQRASTSASRAARLRSTAAGACTRAAPVSPWA